jgi:SCY1-like protein 2
MRGLSSVLPRFSQGLRVRKILPSLVEEMKDTHLLPSILPNVFAIASDLNPAQFSTIVLPSLKPLFAIKDPPQNMITLLDNLEILQSKTDKVSFRESMLHLWMNSSM